MKRSHRLALLAVVSLTAVVAGYAGWTRARAPESAAQEDSYRLWIALSKGFNGEVRYVGSNATYAYFRLGWVFWSYYRLPICAADLPETFSVDSGKSYVVRLHVQPDNTIQIDDMCPNNAIYELGKLDRA